MSSAPSSPRPLQRALLGVTRHRSPKILPVSTARLPQPCSLPLPLLKPIPRCVCVRTLVHNSQHPNRLHPYQRLLQTLDPPALTFRFQFSVDMSDTTAFQGCRPITSLTSSSLLARGQGCPVQTLCWLPSLPSLTTGCYSTTCKGPCPSTMSC